MSRPLRIQYPNAYYHVTCRGNEQREIFRDSEDQQVFLRLLVRSVDIFGVRLLAYALMPNHFHLLLCTPKGNLSEFMRHFNISYTGSFNRRHMRTGHLYQGRYQAFLIDADSYLLEVSRYIHLNPLRMKSKEPSEKRWQEVLASDSTSLPGYLNRNNRKAFIHYTTILDYFKDDGGTSENLYRKFMAAGKENQIASPLEKGKGTGILGNDDFIKEIKKLFGKERKDKRARREQPEFRELGKTMYPDDLIARYAKMVQKSREELTTKGKQSIERVILMELLYRLCNATQREIGEYLGNIDYSAVSQARRRLCEKMKKEPEWGNKFNQIQDRLIKCQE